MTESPRRGAQASRPGIGALLRQSLLRMLRPPPLGRRDLWLLLGLVAIGWLSTSFYEVRPGEQGVVSRLGREVAVTGPGAHFHLPLPIETVQLRKAPES